MAKPKKISRALKLTDQQQVDLAHRADQLMSIVGLVEEPLNIPTRETLDGIFELIKAKQALRALPLQAMLSTTATIPAHEVLQGWVTAAAIDQVEGYRTESTYILACRRIRLLNIDEDPELSEALEQLPAGLDEIVSALMAASRKVEGNEPLKTRLGHLHALLESYQTKQSRQSIKRLHQITMPDLFAGEGASIQQLRDHSPTDEDGRETARTLLDIDPKSPPSHRTHLGLQKHHATTQGERLTGQKMLSPVTWSHLTKSEIERVFPLLYHGVANGGIEDAVLLIAMVTGRKTEQVNALSLVPHNRKKPGSAERLEFHADRLSLLTILDLPEPGLAKPEHGALLMPSTPHLYLPLPKYLLPILKKAPRGKLFCEPEAIKDRLKVIRRQISRRVTDIRLSQAGFVQLSNAGESRTHLARLFGVSEDVCIPLWYANVEAETVLQIYDKWVCQLHSYVKLDPIPFKHRKQAVRIGSKRSPQPVHVANFFRGFRELVRKRLVKATLAEAHNNFVLYTYLILSLSTGHRPVTQPFDLLTDYCRHTHRWLVADKQSRTAPSPRLVVLPPLAVKQLQHYIEHLRQIAVRLGPRSPASRESIDGAVNGTHPFLFFINNNTLKCEPLKPRHIKQRLADLWPIDDNWTRHFLRTELGEAGLDNEQLELLHGHGDFGQEPFAKFSAHSLGSLRAISHAVQELLDELDIKPVEGYGHHHGE